MVRKLKKNLLIFLLGCTICITLICALAVLYNMSGSYYGWRKFVYTDTNICQEIAGRYAYETFSYVYEDYRETDVAKRLENNSTNAEITVYDESGDVIYHNDHDLGLNAETFAFMYQINDQNIDITVSVPEKITIEDDFYLSYMLLNLVWQYRYGAIVGFAAFLIASIVLFVRLIKKYAVEEENGIFILKAPDKIPFDVFTAVTAACAGLVLAISSEILFEHYFGFSMGSVIAVVFVSGWILYFIVVLYLLSLAARIKTKTLFQNTLIAHICLFLTDKVKLMLQVVVKVFEMFPVMWKMILSVAVVFGFNLLCILFIITGSGLFLIVWIIGDAAILMFLCKQTIDWNRLMMCAEQIAKGDVNSKLDTDNMIMDIKRFAENLNEIKNGLDAEVEQRMKSERFKTELITNVSHDLKTPLTSIINYIDLLKNEKDEEKKKEYIEVLERHSLRLKKLTEDLIEASKASTGNIHAELTKTNLDELIVQITAEFQERMEKNELTLEIGHSEKDLHIMADGKLLYRIFDNILSNACKYSMRKTRVYLDIEDCDETIQIIVKNISKDRLNVTADDLMERFVRGDSSRNTEGSGLGLSIAKSLTELQQGTMNLVIDGDLFKVILEFQKADPASGECSPSPVICAKDEDERQKS